VRRLTGDHTAAARDLEGALGIFRDLGNRNGQANALAFLGGVWRQAGDYQGAAWDLQEALGIYQDLGNRDAEVTALNEAGTLSRTRGDLGRAWS
jgi:hypothetical protein